MKRKDIKEAIMAAKANGVPKRDKALFYLNTLDFVLNQSDSERCDYYDRIVLYIMYGIEPDLDTFSSRKKSNFSYIFSLLKTQRKGYINATKTNSYKNLPQGQTIEVASDQEISNKDNKENKLIRNKDDGSNKGASVENTQTTITIDDVDFDKLVDDFNQETKGAFGFLVKPLSEERKRKILFLMNYYHNRNVAEDGVSITGKAMFREAYIKASKSDYLKGNSMKGRPMTFDWMIHPENFGKIISGNYDNKKFKNPFKLFDDD